MNEVSMKILIKIFLQCGRPTFLGFLKSVTKLTTLKLA